MTRTMYDAITPSRIPVSAPQMVAGYVNGRWPSYAEMVSRFPSAVHVSIAVSADTDAQVLDVEQYDATPAEAVDWVLRQRGRKAIPTVYCNTSTWPAVQAAFAARRVALPYWWEANYSTGPSISPGAIAKQFETTPGYDRSIVVGYWPGVDPAPKPAIKPPALKPPVPIPPKGPTMFVMHSEGGDGIAECYVGSGVFVHLAPATYRAYVNAGIPNYGLPKADYDKLRAELVAANKKK